jgi:glutamine synthetase
MNDEARDVMEFMKENDVKFVRLGFSDILGCQKNIAIMADELPSAFEDGVSFDARAIRGFHGVTKTDLLLFPDPSTLKVLPWRPGPGRVIRLYCGIKNTDGSDFSYDGRHILKQVLKRAKANGYTVEIGSECEFYLFKTGDDGEPSWVTIDNGGYMDIAPLDKGEDIRREICLSLEEMGIQPEASHHEQGPGQNEIDFRFTNALFCADNLQTFKSAVKSIAARNGLFASFMPKPIPGAAGSGLHVNISLTSIGRGLFNNSGVMRTAAAESFAAGILAKTPEITLFLNPLANSYERIGSFEAPKYVSWSRQNLSQLMRIPAAAGDKAKMELRSPDLSLNPYTAFALIITAGLDGIERNLALPQAVDADLRSADAAIAQNLTPLPDSLEKAVALSRKSEFAKTVIGEELFEKYLACKERETADFAAAKDVAEFYKERYFNVI